MPRNLYQFKSPPLTKNAVSDPRPIANAAGTIGAISRAPWAVRVRPPSYVESDTERLCILLVNHFNEARHQFKEQPIALWNRGMGND